MAETSVRASNMYSRVGSDRKRVENGEKGPVGSEIKGE